LYTSVIPATAGSTKRGISVQAGPGQKVSLYLKNDQCKKDECLPSKREAPSSNPSLEKKKKDVYTLWKIS
jgi:hypothetical protein